MAFTTLPSQSMNADAAEVLRAVADFTREDDRGPRAAVQTLWSMLHAETYKRGGAELLGHVFSLLATAASVSVVTGCLGNVLRELDANGRADLCERATQAGA